METTNETKDGLPWHMSEIAYDKIDTEQLLKDEPLMFTLAAASFVERASDKYTSELIVHFQDHKEVAGWLQASWEPEEVQHGDSLAKFVTTVWPNFDWQSAYAAFMAEYEPTCSGEYYEEDRGLELVSRCIVETGTSSLYYSIGHYSKEPVLVDLVERIRKDEIRHYKVFLHYFKEYMEKAPAGRINITRAIHRRLDMIRDEDSAMALKYVFKARYPNEPLDSERFQHILKKSTEIIQSNLPIDTAVRMALTPLDLPKHLHNLTERLFTSYARKFAVKAPTA
ncbi:ferritin-like domain-containing protein [Saezia sanguinis]|uniref:ferritin-like domain-containing protein n=1 Tax=Saezia sanguinis TaxID=1965230 RepID=UPI00304C20DE